jgi:hypothetical protein
MAKRSVDAKHTLREVLLLQLLGKHPNVREKLLCWLRVSSNEQSTNGLSMSGSDHLAS